MGPVPGVGRPGCVPGAGGTSASSCRRATSGFTSRPWLSAVMATCWPAAQPAVPACGFVEAFGVRERVGRPCQQREAVANRIDQHLRPGEARQVQIPREVLDELPHGDVIAARPQHVVQVLAEDCRPEARDEEVVAAQLPARAHRQGIAAREPGRRERRLAPAASSARARAPIDRSPAAARSRRRRRPASAFPPAAPGAGRDSARPSPTRIDDHARYRRSASSRSCRRTRSAARNTSVFR